MHALFNVQVIRGSHKVWHVEFQKCLSIYYLQKLLKPYHTLSDLGKTIELSQG